MKFIFYSLTIIDIHIIIFDISFRKYYKILFLTRYLTKGGTESRLIKNDSLFLEKYYIRYWLVVSWNNSKILCWIKFLKIIKAYERKFNIQANNL